MEEAWREAESATPKVQPWVLFGVALVVSVGSVLFAAATWIIRAEQVDRAQSARTQVEESLDVAHGKLEEAADREQQLMAASEHLASQLESTRANLVEAERREASVASELRSTQGELAATRRDLEHHRNTVAEDRRKYATPTSLLRGSLRDALGACDDVVVLVTVQNGGLVTEGAVREHVRQLGLTECGFAYSDSGDTLMTLSVVAAVDADINRVGLSVQLKMMKVWKIPGQFKSHAAVVWSRHSVGLTSHERAPAFVEQLVADLVQTLAEDLAK